MEWRSRRDSMVETNMEGCGAVGGEYLTRNLAETIHSLLGMKARLTSAWIESVCNILQSPAQYGISPCSDAPGEPASMDRAAEAEVRGAVSSLKEEITELQHQLNQLNCRRRQVLNDYLDLKGNIRVFCRVRPLSDAERAMPISGSDSSNVFLEVPGRSRKSYTFDKVFEPSSSQAEVFCEVEPVIKSALDGFNASIFAYGQTGTGKTFTMEGTADTPGVVLRAIEALFKHASESNNAYSFSFSMLEIYMGNLRDLLVTQPKRPTDPPPPCLVIQTDPEGGTEIENLSEIQVNDYSQVLELYELGCRFRSTAATNTNATSSRSHCMTRISITCLDAPERRRETSKVWLIDLGGSERVLKTKAHGRRLEEGKAINLSLSALGDVVNALHRKKPHIPFRNSKLTQVLKDSLGEDSKTLMLVHVSPREEDLCETICALSFATRVKSICLGAEGDTKEKARKEAAMQNLRKTIDDIEGQSRNLKGEIEKLNRWLLDLMRTSSSSYKEDCSTVKGMEIDVDVRKFKSECGGPDRSKVPRFMRPTVCSQRKCGISYQSARRMPPHCGAGSVNFPVKTRTEYSSEFGDSRSSLGDLKSMSAGNRTECSKDTSTGECDAKKDASSEKGRLYLPNYTNERIIRDLKDQPSKRIPAIPLPLQPKHRRNRKLSVADFQLVDHEVLVWQGSECGGSTSGTDIQSADSSTDAFSVSTSETATEACESVKCTRSSSTEEDRADNFHHPCEVTYGYDNSTHKNGHEHWCPEPNAESEDKGPSSTGGLLQFKARKALFRGDSNRDNAGKPSVSAEAEGTGKRKTGLADNLGLKIVQIMLVVLIGVGLRCLGFEHDFFHGLIF